MKKSEIQIDATLQEANCSIISPRNEYTKNAIGIIKEKVARDIKNLKKLGNMVSEHMVKNYKKQLIESLKVEVPILYVDCKNKGENSILDFVIKEFLKQNNLQQSIEDEIINYDYLDQLDILMERQGLRYLYLYLDNIQNLNLDEQSTINRILYARGAIGLDKYVRLKINNGNDSWKTRKSDTGHRIETPHDYSERYIDEKDIETI